MRLRRRPADQPVVVCGSGSRRLGGAICTELGVRPAAAETMRFAEGTIFVRLLENVRGRDVYVVQSTIYPTNDNVLELLFWLDACRRASAASVTAVVPYFSYGKGDKKDEPRVSIRARVLADAIEVAGADRVVTMDLHAPQIQGFFRVPVDDLYAMPILVDAIRRAGVSDPVVVSPDSGYAKMARRFARKLGAGFAIADKTRPGHGEEAEYLGLLVVAGARLVGECETAAEPPSEATCHLRVARVGGDDDRVGRPGAPDRLDEDRHRVEVVHRDAEEALDLRSVQVHRHDAVCSRDLDRVG